MNNLVSTESHAMAAIDPSKMATALKAFQNDGGSSPLFLNLPSQTGKWSIGRDKEPVPAGTRVAMDPTTLETGYVAWYGGKPLRTNMVSMTSGETPEMPTSDDSGKPLPTDVDPKTGEPLCKISPQYAVTVTLEGGIKAIIRGGSIGFKYALEDVLQKIILRARSGETKLYPVVELAVGSYANAYGKQYPPKFNVVGWM